jgi:putative SOS response-associated peptidase YedK
MCGRYASTRSNADLSLLFEALDDTGDGLVPDYNIAPTDPAPVVRVSSAGQRVLSVVRWGLVPPWAKDTRGAARMINARAETILTSNAFAPSFARRRCLVPADGWYEWVRLAGNGNDRKGKQAYYMTAADGAVLAFAGIWSVWGQGDDRVLTCGIVTTAAVDDLALVHDRMPLVLPPERWNAWLDVGREPDGARLLAPPPAEFVAGIEIRPVGAAVGDVHNDGPDLVVPVPAPPLGGPRESPTDLTLF